jgi:hypothetical protein
VHEVQATISGLERSGIGAPRARPCSGYRLLLVLLLVLLLLLLLAWIPTFSPGTLVRV